MLVGVAREYHRSPAPAGRGRLAPSPCARGGASQTASWGLVKVFYRRAGSACGCYPVATVVSARPRARMLAAPLGCRGAACDAAERTSCAAPTRTECGPIAGEPMHPDRAAVTPTCRAWTRLAWRCRPPGMGVDWRLQSSSARPISRRGWACSCVVPMPGRESLRRVAVLLGFLRPRSGLPGSWSHVARRPADPGAGARSCRQDHDRAPGVSAARP